MNVTLHAPDAPELLSLLARYAHRGASDDTRPFHSGNVVAWEARTQGPVTRQTWPYALRGLFRSLPAPWSGHLDPTFDPEHADDAFERLEPGACDDQLIGYLARGTGLVCAVATEAEARADLETLRRWCGPRRFAARGAGVFRVGRCAATTYVWLATGRAVLFLFLRTD